MGELRDIDQQIANAGFQWIAIAPDSVETVKATKAKYSVQARFLSDAQMKAAHAFRVAYEVDQPTLQRLKEHGVDLEVASGQRHHQLPVPAVFVVSRDGLIQFAYANPDYKVRLDPKLLIAVLNSARG